MTKLISVLMSTYNTNVEYLDASIKSILEQTYSNFEFIIVCDGSQDEYDYIKQKYDDQRIKLVLHERNKGLPISLNEGIRISNGEYIARMDSDDIAIKNRLEIQMEYMEEHPEIEISGMYARCFGKENRNARTFFVKPEEIEVLSLYLPVMIHPTVMFRKSYIEKAGLYSLDTYFGEDTMMWAQGFAAGCKYANVPEYLFKFRLNDDFFNRRRGWKHAKGILTLRWKVNKMLHYPVKAYLYAIAYAGAKMMPKGILNLIYKTAR